MDNYKFTEFGNRLKTLREQCHFKQGELADKIGITRQSMSNYESGKHSPDVNVIVKMADCLGCSTDYLMGLTEHSTYERQAEFDESLFKLSQILCTIPEPLREKWLDIFVGTAEWIEKDLNGDIQFHHSAVTFFSTAMSLIDSCLNAKEKQLQGSYTGQSAQKTSRERISAMLQLRNELNNLDFISYECTENSQLKGDE